MANKSYHTEAQRERKRNRLAAKEARELKSKKSRAEIKKEKFAQRDKDLIPDLVPRNEGQAQALQNLDHFDMNIITGLAGTGKTELACWYATKLWLSGEIDTIIITRPNKTLGKDPGAVPGNDGEKILTMCMSMLLKFRKNLGPARLKSCLCLNLTDLLFKDISGIALLPLEKVQGLSMDSRWLVIADETQNASEAQVKSLVTRQEEGARLIVLGDTLQPAMHHENGLKFLVDVVKENNMQDMLGITNLEGNCRSGISGVFTKIFAEMGEY